MPCRIVIKLEIGVFQVQEVGLKADYQQDAVFALQIRMIPAVAFVPLADVIPTFEELKAIMPNRATPVLDYFERNYIGQPHQNGNGRAQPLFAPELWNVHLRTLNGRPRTNNHIEGYHRRFSANVNASKPNVYNFLEVLKREEHFTRAQIEQMVAGMDPPPPRKKYRDVNRNIEAIVRRYARTPRMDYLRGIAYNFNF